MPVSGLKSRDEDVKSSRMRWISVNSERLQADVDKIRNFNFSDL